MNRFSILSRRPLLEVAMTALGRHLKLRGVSRFIQKAYPVNHPDARHVCGIRQRADGLKMSLDSRSWIDWNVLFRGSYEPHPATLIRDLLKPGMVAADVGANIGVHTLTMARAVGDDGKVLAFEPQPGAANILRSNLKLNDLEINTSLMQVGLGAEKGTLTLSVPHTGEGFTFRSGMATFGKLDGLVDSHEVPVKTLDNIADKLGLKRLDLIKIDIQGHEEQAFKGMWKSIDRYHPSIIFEYEKWAWETGHSSLDAVQKQFKKAGYRLLRIVPTKDSYTLRQIGRMEELGSHSEILATTQAASVVESRKGRF